MPKKEFGSTLQLAQELVSHLPKEMDDKLQTLILRAKDEDERMVEIEIIDLLSSHESTRRWMREKVGLLRSQGDATRGYGTLAGSPSALPASQKWVCPANKDHWTLVIQEDEDPPTCEKHKIEMVRIRK